MTETEIVYNEREAGIYPCSFVRIEEFEFTDKATNEIEKRWRWVFIDEDMEQLDTLTSRHFKPRSNGLKLFTGILGRPPKSGDKPSDSYGKMVNVIYGPNQNGKLTITDISPLKSK